MTDPEMHIEMQFAITSSHQSHRDKGDPCDGDDGDWVTEDPQVESPLDKVTPGGGDSQQNGDCVGDVEADGGDGNLHNSAICSTEICRFRATFC